MGVNIYIDINVNGTTHIVTRCKKSLSCAKAIVVAKPDLKAMLNKDIINAVTWESRYVLLQNAKCSFPVCKTIGVKKLDLQVTLNNGIINEVYGTQHI